MPNPTVECGTCGNRFVGAHPAGGGVCPQCREVVDPPAAASVAKCPQCGEPVAAGAAACGACGELLGDFDARGGVRAGGLVLPDGAGELSLGAVWRAAWRDWQDHLGTLIGGLLLAGVVGSVSTTAIYGGAVVLGLVLAAAAGDPGLAWLPLLVVGLGAYVFAAVVSTWLLCGLAKLHLDAARAGTAEAPRGPEVGRVFAGEGFPRVLLAALTLGTFLLLLIYGPQFVALGALVGFGGVGGGAAGLSEIALLIVVYILPMVVDTVAFCLFWPVPFLAVDRPHLRGLRPVAACFTLPAGRWGAHLSVGLAALGVQFLGWLVVCVGSLFTLPLAGLILAHGYARLAAGGDAETGL